jgi:hypothetical protein
MKTIIVNASVQFAAPPENPVQRAAEKERDRGSDQRAAKQTHRASGQVEKMSEREHVSVGVSVQQIGKPDTGQWRMRNDGQSRCERSNNQAGDQKNSRGDSA